MLERHKALASVDADETRAFLAGKNLAFRRAGAGRQAAAGFRADISGAYAPDFYIAHMRYSVDVEIDAPAEREDYGLSAPVGGLMAVDIGRDVLACSERRTAIASPGQPNTMRIDGGTERLALSMQRSALRRRLACLTGEAVVGDVTFDAALDLDAGPGRLIVDAMRLLVAAEDRGDAVFADPLRLAHFEDLALSSLLLYQPHSHMRLLERPSRAPASRDVRRAIDFIEAHLDAPIQLEDLVAVAGVPGRTLNDHFRAFTGLAPMAYLRKARMTAVREALLAGDAASVTEAAMRFGFLHLGRFAVAYGDAFGESPSTTLARARRLFEAPSAAE